MEESDSPDARTMPESHSALAAIEAHVPGHTVLCDRHSTVERPDIFTETHIMGDDTRVLTVRAEHCEALAARHIAHVAVVDAASPYTVVRTHLSGAFMQVCLGGEGHTLLDGRWHSHTRGYRSEEHTSELQSRENLV